MYLLYSIGTVVAYASNPLRATADAREPGKWQLNGVCMYLGKFRISALKGCL